MENTFDLKKFLVENRLTSNAKIIAEKRLALTPNDTAIVNKVANILGTFLESGQARRITR